MALPLSPTEKTSKLEIPLTHWSRTENPPYIKILPLMELPPKIPPSTENTPNSSKLPQKFLPKSRPNKILPNAKTILNHKKTHKVKRTSKIVPSKTKNGSMNRIPGPSPQTIGRSWGEADIPWISHNISLHKTT